MRTVRLRASVILVAATACIGFAKSGGADATEASGTAARVSPPGKATVLPPGKAMVALKGDDVDVTGEFETRLCGDAYLLGKGMSYQVRAGDWQITVASETRSNGDVPLNTADGDVNVVVTANGPGRQFVRSPAGTGTLKVAGDYLRAEVDLELRALVSPQKARLQATFVCTP
jgi:hypothetical protein